MKYRLFASAILALAVCGTVSARDFVHPGISYTQGQLDRMKAMVEAKVEPYYTTFLNLKNSEHASLTRNVSDRGTQIKEGQFNGTVGIDGRCAHDLALLWKLTDDTRYADKAVQYLNANNHYTNTSARGTGPLDNGKINLLIEAAELMRDYEGWKPEDQQKFKNMLTYPYYSSSEDVCAKYVNWTNDDANGITFYWNIFNGDASRHGNQGMFGMLAMLAMGIYLDNDTIYDRALRYVSGLPHRSDDLPYTAGPPITPSTPSSTSEYMKTYTLEGRKSQIEDYGYDELLQYYFYPNGQCQESSRDQGHVLAGMHKYIEFAEIAWNQGDKFYSILDNRLLKGIEFNLRYNLSKQKSYPDQPQPWEPSGYTTDWDAVTLDNGMYLQTRTRSGRWESIKPSPDGRGGVGNVGSRESAYAHYRVRAGLSNDNTLWLGRAHDYMIENYGTETSGTAPNWFYEWNGWGTLTKTLDTWMAGDPVSYVSGERKSGIHTLPGIITAPDFDYYNISEEADGHTYHRLIKGSASGYRPDGEVEIKSVDGHWAVTSNSNGDWLNYTVACPVADTYDVYVTARSSKASSVGVAVAGSQTLWHSLTPSDSAQEYKIATCEFPAGASVIRLSIGECGDDLEIYQIRVVYNSTVEKNVKFEGLFDARSKQFIAEWSLSGMLASDIDLLRSVTGDLSDAEVISKDNTFGRFVDENLSLDMPGYTYWLRYKDSGVECFSEPVSFKWGYLEDWFRDAGSSEWSVPGANGSLSFDDGSMTLECLDNGTARLSRNWSFPFHGGNYPVLAFCMDRPEGTSMSLYSGSNSWKNDYDTFHGKIGDNVFYYDLTDGAFQTSKGVDKASVATETVTSLPLQIRFAAPANSKIKLNWIATFENLKELSDAVADPENRFSDVDMIDSQTPGAGNISGIYNLTGVCCGRNPNDLPVGIYIIDGKKIVKTAK